MAVFLVIIIIAAAGAFAYFLLPDILASPEVYTETRELSLSSSGIETFEVHSDLNEISIVNGPGKTIQVQAEIEINLDEEKGKEQLEKNLILELNKRGSRASFSGVFDRSLLDHFQGVEEFVYVTLTVPLGIDLDIQTSGSALYLGNLKNRITVVESEGDVTAEDVSGPVSIVNGRGDVRGNRITGDIEIHDTAGMVELQECRGAVMVEDGMGAVIIKQVSGDVEIIDKRDQIRLETVSGDVSISGAGRGDIIAEEIGGNVRINGK
jgi:hypothetical protein